MPATVGVMPPSARLRIGVNVVIGRNVDVGDGDVDFRDLHADEVLDGPVDGLAGVVRDLLKGVGVLDDERDINGYLGLADFHADALGQVFLPDLFAQAAQRPGRSAAQRVDAVDLLDCDAGDLGHHAVGDGGGAAAVGAGSLAACRGVLACYPGRSSGQRLRGVRLDLVELNHS